MRRAEVAVFLPLPTLLSYSVPEPLHLAVGSRVWVRVHGEGVEGVVVELGDGEPPPGTTLLPVLARLEAPSPPRDLVALARWVGDYYLAPPGEVMRLILPAGGQAREARRVALTDEGRRAAAGIGAALEPPDLDGLGLRERVLLERLHSAGGVAEARALARAIDGSKIALRTLEGRRLVTTAAQVEARQGRTSTLFRLARPPTEGEAVLQRAPRRRELLAHLAAGPRTLDELRQLFPGAREAMAPLVAAGLVATSSEAAPRDPFVAATSEPPAERPILHRAQAAALARLQEALARRTYAPFLLHGVTGSGKTEVYLRIIAEARAQGLGALVLVPEISLTPQLAARFRARFGDDVAVLHSGLTERDRFEAWLALERGRVHIALGARSAVFAPVARLGVVVIDEEHDGSFKQEDGVRYHGRDVAMRRARLAGALAILGSATPSLETYEAAWSGRLGLLELPERATPRPLPSVQVIDLRQHRLGEDGLFSAPLAAAVEATLQAGEQAILFLNRRGFATFVLCQACGHRFTCPDCAVSLTYHRRGERLACHYCGHLEASPGRCPSCAAEAVVRLGMGTERVESIVAARFPGARVARLDRDIASSTRALVGVLDGLRRREIDILVGTQMVAKGHDFPGVTLVGVMLADTGMGLPDFRATERTFQLLEQVAGRAGRGDRPGRVLIQTFSPGHPAVSRACDHDYRRFFDDERAARAELGYPPFCRLAAIRFDGEDGAAVEAVARETAARLTAAAALTPPSARVELRGPAEAPLSRLKGRVRWQLLVKAATPRALREVTATVMGPRPRGVRMVVDVDPVSML